MSADKVVPSVTAKKNRHATDDLLAAISEDIRDPMNGILGMTEVLLETEMVPQQRLCVETIRQLGEVALSLLNNAIDLSKIAAGMMKLEEVPFGLRATVEDAVGIFAGAAYSKGLQLESLVTADVPDSLLGDPMRLRQILVNLIGNAVKFTDRGEITVTVKSSEMDGDCVQLQCEIVDTGIGIPQDSQRRIAEAASEADHVATTRLAGKGLSLVKQLVALHGGEFGVISEPGVGSTCLFQLPLKRTPVSGQQNDASVTSLSGVHVLLVDDNATILSLLLHKVSSLGMSADTALGGDGAIVLCLANRYDAILIDEEMPGMDGIEVAKTLRASGMKMDRLIMLTASPGGENRERAIAAGVEWFLTKPVRQDLLVSCVASVVGVRSSTMTSKEGNTGSFLIPRILVVDDNAINRDVCIGMLEQLDRFTISVAANGHEALEELDRQPYDLVLMDCQMPLMNGYEATGRIRQREVAASETPSARLPIIALTAYAHLEDREHCLAAGMDDYLAKPFTKEQLRAALQRWLPTRER